MLIRSWCYYSATFHSMHLLRHRYTYSSVNSRAWGWWFTEVFELFALTSVLHSCFLEHEGAGLPKYSRFLPSLRYCILAFSGLKEPIYRSNQAFCSHFGIALLLSWTWIRRFTEVFEIFSPTSVLLSCFLELEGAGLPKYSSFLLSLRYYLFAFSGLKEPVYRSIRTFCSHFGIALLLSWVWRSRFTEVFELFAPTSVLHSCFLGLWADGYRSILDFGPHFGIALLLSWVWRSRFTEVFELFAPTSVLLSCFLGLGLTVYRSIQAFCSHFGIALLLSWVRRSRLPK